MSNHINDGGPAFPQPNHLVDTDRGRQEARGWMMDSGMSLRDWFAAHATEEDINSRIPATQEGCSTFKRTLGFWPTREWAKYQYADDMIAQRSKGGAK